MTTTLDMTMTMLGGCFQAGCGWAAVPALTVSAPVAALLPALLVLRESGDGLPHRRGVDSPGAGALPEVKRLQV